jgi:hypothetical protein
MCFSSILHLRRVDDFFKALISKAKKKKYKAGTKGDDLKRKKKFTKLNNITWNRVNCYLEH